MCNHGVAQSGAGGGTLDSTYEITVRGCDGADFAARVTERFELLSAARRLLPGERVGGCMWRVAPNTSGVEVRFDEGGGRSHYSGLLQCGSVWHCPVCAARVAEQSRGELRYAVGVPGHLVFLATYTVGHHGGERLIDVLEALRGAYDAAVGGRAGAAIRAKHEIVGTISNLEVTWGRVNGFHPHLHVLVFMHDGGAGLVRERPGGEAWYRKYVDERGGELELDLWERWRHVAGRLGHVVDAQAFDVRASDTGVAAYVSKYGRLPSEERVSGRRWGVDDEMAASVRGKRGRGDNLSVWQVLAGAGGGDGELGRVFVEYARAMKGRRKLRYSKGFREYLGLDRREKSIEELTVLDDTSSRVLAFLTRDEWRVVRENGARAALLAVAALGDVGRVNRFLSSLPGYASVGAPIRVLDDEFGSFAALVSFQRGF